MTLKKYILYLFLSLNVTISYFILGNDTNALLLCMIGLSPMILLTVKRSLDNVDILMFSLLLLMFICGYAKSSFRIVSYLYGFCFVCSYICLKDAFLKGNFSLARMHRIIRNLVYAYAIVLLIQQLCVIGGIQPINQYFGFADKWKLPALAQEPSHMAIFMFFFMYSYMLISEKIMGHRYCMADAKKEKWVWIAYFWCMLTSQSTSAIMYCGLLFLRYFKLKTIVKYVGIGFFVILILTLVLKNSEASQRVVLFSEALFTFDISKIDEADHSAAYRFFPLFYLVEHIDIFSVDFWFGHGLDFGKETLNAYAQYISDDGTYDGHVNMGGFFGYILDYGMLCFIILCIAVKKAIQGIHDIWLIVFYIWLNLFIGFNMQLFWSSTILMTYLAIYRKKKILVKDKSIRDVNQCSSYSKMGIS